MPYGQYFHVVSFHLQPTAKLCLKHSRCCVSAHGKGLSAREQVKKSCAKCIQSYICSHPSDTLLTKPQTGSCFTEVPPTAYLYRTLCSALLNHQYGDDPFYQQQWFIFPVYILATACRSLPQLGFINIIPSEEEALE